MATLNEGNTDQSDDESWNDVWDSDHNVLVKMQPVAHSVQNHSSASDLPKNERNSTLLSSMKVNDNKAGMQGLDRDKINSIIYEASKGSKYYENELRKEEQILKRIEEQQKKLDQLTPRHVLQGGKEADRILCELDSDLDLSRTIVHIDMDAFYAAVETRDNPSLKDVPMAVGGNNMLSTSNYVARKYGVRAAMPGFIGKKLCPELVIVPLNFEKYQRVSKEIREILVEYDAHMCPMSLDEAYLDITDHLLKRNVMSEAERTFRIDVSRDCNDNKCDAKQTDENCDMARECMTFGVSAEETVKEIRFRIQQKTRLTASAGIAPNTLLAKICSDRNKPNGQFSIEPSRDAILSFVQDLPIRKVCGIGKVSERMLSSLGIKSCGDIHDKRGILFHLYSDISFNHFLRISHGIGSAVVERSGQRKSLSTERTFSEISEPEELYRKCYELCEGVVDGLQDESLQGKTVTVKIKTVAFEVKVRSRSLRHHTQDINQIYSAAKDLIKIEIANCAPMPLRLRLMGVRMSNLSLLAEGCSGKQSTISGLLSKHRDNAAAVSQSTTDDNTLLQDIPSSESTNVTCENDDDMEHKQDSDPSGRDFSNVTMPQLSDAVLSRLPFGAVFAWSNNTCQAGTSPSNPHHHTQSDVMSSKPHAASNYDEAVLKASPKKSAMQVGCGSASESPSKRLTDSQPTCLNRKRPHSGDSGIETEQSNASLTTNESSSYVCPVCCQTLTETDLSGFNDHIDLCLYKQQSGGDADLSPLRSQVRDEPDHKMEEDIAPLQCPVCHLVLPQRDLVMFNSHVDTCLNKSVVRQLIHDQDEQLVSTKKQDRQSNAKRHKSSPKPINAFFNRNK